MNDEFLNQYRKAPRREFAKALYTQLNQQKPSTPMFTQSVTFRHLMNGFAVLCLALIMTFAISQTARAKLIGLVNDIGGMAFTETTDYPGSSGPVKTFPEKRMSLEEARLVLSFEFSLPDYIPEDFIFDDSFVIAMVSNEYPFQYVHLRWRNKPASGYIYLFIQKYDDPLWAGSFIVGPGGVEEVFINDQAGALVRGAWNSDKKEWGATQLLDLRWQREGLTYSLSAAENLVSMEEMIEIASSIP